MNPFTTIVPATVTLVALLISAALSWSEYKKSRNRELIKLIIGWMMLAAFPFSSIIFYTLGGENLLSIRILVTITTLTLNMFGFLVHWYYFHQYDPRPYSNREYLMIGFALFSFGMIPPSYRVEWTGVQWDNTWEPQWALAFAMLGITWISIEVIWILVRKYRSDNLRSKYDRLIIYGWVSILFSPFVVFFERIAFHLNNSIIFMIFVAFGALQITFGIFMQPKLLHISPLQYLTNSIGSMSEFGDDTPVTSLTLPLLNHFENTGDIKNRIETMIFMTKFYMTRLQILEARETLLELDEIIGNSPQMGDSFRNEIAELRGQLGKLISDVRGFEEVPLKELYDSSLEETESLEIDPNLMKRLKISDVLILSNIHQTETMHLSYTESFQELEFISRSNRYKRVKVLIELGLLKEVSSVDDLTKKDITLTEAGIEFISKFTSFIQRKS